MHPIKISAFDENDLFIIAAHLHDATIKLNNAIWLKKEKKFAFICKRKKNKNIKTGVHFNHVTAVTTKNIKHNKKNETLRIISILFQPNQKPSGDILIFGQNNKIIKISVDCIETAMSDIIENQYQSLNPKPKP